MAVLKTVLWNSACICCHRRWLGLCYPEQIYFHSKIQYVYLLCSAVDNILLKLRKEGVDFLRLGRTSGVHPGVADALPGGTRHPAPTVAAMRQLAATSSVV